MLSLVADPQVQTSSGLAACNPSLPLLKPGRTEGPRLIRGIQSASLELQKVRLQKLLTMLKWLEYFEENLKRDWIEEAAFGVAHDYVDNVYV